MHRPAIELSAAVVKVDIGLKVSLTQNQSLQCVTPALMHAKIPQLRDATELNNDGIITSGEVHYQTELNLSIFQKIFNQRRLQFPLAYSFSS